MTLIVIENAALNGARAVVALEALPSHEARGWEAVGPTSVPGREPVRTDAEQSEYDAAESARLAAIAAPRKSTRKA